MIDFIKLDLFQRCKIRKSSFDWRRRFLDPAGGTADSYLGTEVDFEFSYNLVKNVNLIAGYSQMFATESMEIIKGGSKDETNNWGWIMITFKPTLFNKNFKP